MRRSWGIVLVGACVVGSTASPATGQPAPEGAPPPAQIAYTAFERATVMHADGSNPTRIVDDPTHSTMSSLTPRWSDDGTQIVAAVFDGFNGGSVLANIDPRLDRGLAAAGPIDAQSGPVFSSTGDHVLLVGSERVQQTPPIFAPVVVALALDEEGHSETFRYGNEPSWSPDGTHVVYDQHWWGLGLPDVATTLSVGDITTGDTEALVGTESALEPAWSPDGSRIAYAASDGLHLIDPDGTDDVTITPEELGAVSAPTWRPDSGRLAFGAGGDLWAIDPDGSDLLQLTDAPEADTQPAWSPDGQDLAFTSERGQGVTDVFRMNADGSDEVNLTNAAGRDQDPTWAPPGAPDWTERCLRNEFTDIEDIGLLLAADWAWCEGIVRGYPGGELRPNLAITRGDAARLFYATAGRPPVGDLPPLPWDDVPPGLRRAARWVAANDLIAGMPGGHFRPTRSLTRGQAARLAFRYADRPPGSPPHGLSDVPPALDRPVRWAVAEGFFDPPMIAPFGDDTYRPDQPIRRGKLINVACRLADLNPDPPENCQDRGIYDDLAF